jgi:hypothetical protein
LWSVGRQNDGHGAWRASILLGLISVVPTLSDKDHEDIMRGRHGGTVLCFLSLELDPGQILIPCAVAEPLYFFPGWAICSAAIMRKRALEGCMATSHQMAKATLPFLETRYGYSFLPSSWTLQSFLNCTILIYHISQAMGKLGTSLSSGHVMMNGTLTQVLLIGAPTHGRSRATKLCFLKV